MANTRRIIYDMLRRMDDRPLTSEELEQLRRNLALLSRSGVEEAYKQAHKDCVLKGDTLPGPGVHSVTGSSVEAGVDLEKEVRSPYFRSPPFTLGKCPQIR
jgi:hypothetical protein